MAKPTLTEEPSRMVGSAVFYHPYLVHDRSENFLAEPRAVIFMHYRLVDAAPRAEEVKFTGLTQNSQVGPAQQFDRKSL